MANVHCDCGRITGVRCEWTGPKSDTVLIEWMPEHLRGSHAAAGNRGVFPANGSERVRVESSCADMIHDADPEWTEIVS